MILLRNVRSSSKVSPTLRAIGVMVLCGSPSVSAKINAASSVYPLQPASTCVARSISLVSSLLTDTQYGQRPFYNAGFHIFVSRDRHMLFNLCLRHGKGIMPALEMIVAKDRTSYDRKIRIGAKEIMWEQLYKIKQLDKCISLDLHRSMLTVKYDTMFIVVNIWRVLEAPWTVIDGDRNDPVVLPCRMIDSACIAFIFRTKQTFWITAGFYQLGSCDSLSDLFPAWTG